MESFYGGRSGAAFVIVKRFDGLDIPEKTKYCYKWFAQDKDKYFYVPLIEINSTNYTKYPNQGAIPCDGSTTVTSQDGIVSDPLDIAYQEGMRQCFAKGGASTSEVNYGEYVIIDTIAGAGEYNNPDNGKVYRRGMNYNYDAISNPLCGAEYIGQIVGPKGSAPTLDMDTVQNIINTSEGQMREYLPKQGDSKEGIVPGRYFDNDGNIIYNDNIDYAWTTVRDNNGNLTGAFIGFNFPYLIPEFYAGFRSPYYTRDDYDEGRITDKNLIGTPITTNLDLFVDNGLNLDDPNYGETGHPFFRKWKITIPKGIKGDTLKDFKIFPTIVIKGAELYEVDENGHRTGDVYIADSDMPIEVSSYWDDFDNGCVTVKGSAGGHEGIYQAELEDTANLHYGYLLTWYDEHEDGSDHKWIDVGPYRTIKKTHLSADGLLSVFYTSDYTDPITGFKTANADVLEEALRWIWLESDPEKTKGVQMDKDGSVTIWYNTLDENGEHEFQKYDNILAWLNNATLNRNGHFKLQYNNDILYDEDNPYSYGTPGWRMENNKANWETDLTWPTQISLTEEGVLKFLYNNNLLNDIYPADETFDGVIDRVEGSYSFIMPWLVKTKLFSDGHFNFKFNNDRLYDENDPDWDLDDHTLYKPQITWITKVRLDGDGTFKIWFNNDMNKDAIVAEGGTWNDDDHSYQKQIVWVSNISLTDTGLFTFSFNNDKYTEKQVIWVKDVQIAEDGTITFYRCNNTEYTSPYKLKYLKNVWIDTGEVEGTGDQKVHIQYNNNEIVPIGNPINYIVESLVSDKNNIYGVPAGHLLVWYSDPAYRAVLKSTYPTRVYDYKGTKDTAVKNGWFDLGYIKGEAGGVHIIGNVTTENDLYNDGASHTEPKKPEDIGGSNEFAGWVMTVGDGTTDPAIYAFDYKLNRWYPLGGISSSLLNPEMIIATGSPSDEPAILNNNGFWAVTNLRTFAM